MVCLGWTLLAGNVRAQPVAAAEPVSVAAARVIDSLPMYQPGQVVQGTIRLWGHGSRKRDFMGQLVRDWFAAFNHYQPAVKLDYRMYGTASAVGALYTGAGDLAILGEEISPAATQAFVRARGYAPTQIQLATGSVDVNYFDYAHMIFVNRANPIERLTLPQLEAIFGTEHRHSSGNIRRWGELGLQEEWTEQRIQPYGWKVDDDFALFFRETVLAGSHRWNPTIKEFVNVEQPDGSIRDRGQQILDALAHDRYGIAISNVRYADPQVKALSLARAADGPYYSATAENLMAQRYPLTRIIPAVIDQPPGQPMEPVLREFLRFILSKEGQQLLVRDSGYLPLDAAAIHQQLEQLQ